MLHFLGLYKTFLVPASEPSLESFKKKDVIRILSQKKAYNACKYNHSVYVSTIPGVCNLRLFGSSAVALSSFEQN